MGAMEKEFRLHKGARTALNIAAILCIVVVVAAPFGIWILVRVAGGRITLSDNGLVARALGTVQFLWKDVDRLGICLVPIVARGIGGALARQKVGGDNGVNVCVILRGGKKRHFTISMYEDHQKAMEEISKAVGKPYEDLKMGMLGIKWPDVKAAA
jgi:hypothetical protein